MSKTENLADRELIVTRLINAPREIKENLL
jgi:hypothetical protein